MALQAVGLRTYIWNNNLKSILLLAGFPLLLFGVAYAVLLLIESASATSISAGFARAAANMPGAAAVALGASAAWFAVAYVSHQKIIDMATGSRAVERAEQPALYDLLENLCISRGMPMPKLRIIETPALNAFASGLSERKAVVTVTRGLIDTLEAPELEAVLAHELSHIRHRDVRLLVIAAVFVGVISLVGEAIFRGMFYGRMPRMRSNRRSTGGGGGLVLVALAIVAVSYALAIVVRFALSRRREFLADAGAVELTKNPDAMISALRKISGRSAVERAPDEVREMFFDNRPTGFAGWFATHPPIEARIEALERYAGGHDIALSGAAL